MWNDEAHRHIVSIVADFYFRDRMGRICQVHGDARSANSRIHAKWQVTKRLEFTSKCVHFWRIVCGRWTAEKISHAD
jgi:hypothetical protein